VTSVQKHDVAVDMDEKCEAVAPVSAVVESRWDLAAGASKTTSCGLSELARSTSLRHSLRRSREPYWIISKSARSALHSENPSS